MVSPSTNKKNSITIKNVFNLNSVQTVQPQNRKKKQRVEHIETDSKAVTSPQRRSSTMESVRGLRGDHLNI